MTRARLAFINKVRVNFMREFWKHPGETDQPPRAAQVVRKITPICMCRFVVLSHLINVIINIKQDRNCGRDRGFSEWVLSYVLHYVLWQSHFRSTTHDCDEGKQSGCLLEMLRQRSHRNSPEVQRISEASVFVLIWVFFFAMHPVLI